MMHKKIVDIIRLSVSGNNLKKVPKWMRANQLSTDGRNPNERF